jgi:hypothetical protein
VLQVARIPNSIRTLNESEHLLKSGSKVRNAGVLALHALGEELDALFKLGDPALLGCKEMRVLGPSCSLGHTLYLDGLISQRARSLSHCSGSRREPIMRSCQDS